MLNVATDDADIYLGATSEDGARHENLDLWTVLDFQIESLHLGGIAVAMILIPKKENRLARYRAKVFGRNRPDVEPFLRDHPSDADS